MLLSLLVTLFVIKYVFKLIFFFKYNFKIIIVGQNWQSKQKRDSCKNNKKKKLSHFKF